MHLREKRKKEFNKNIKCLSYLRLKTIQSLVNGVFRFVVTNVYRACQLFIETGNMCRT